MATSALTRPSLTGLDELVEQSPGYKRQEIVKGMVALLFKTARAAVTPPYPWWRDCVVEMSLGIRRSFWPLAISSFVFSYGVSVAAIGGVTDALGTPDRFFVAQVGGWVREVGCWLSAMIFAGVVGSAITADLGARKIRDELDALKVLGIDPVKTLVVPRVVAVVLIAPILFCFAVIVGLGSSYLLAPLVNTSGEVSLDVANTLTAVGDLASVLLRMVVIGVMVGVVASYKGLESGLGTEGVGTAVKETVIITFFALWLLNTLWMVFVLAAWPSLSMVRG